VIKIAPSILSADFSKLGDEIRMLDRAKADYVHIDIMDGHFVPNLTIGPMVVKAIRPLTGIPFDVHLMVENPLELLDAFIEAGADSITMQVETLRHLHRAVHAVKERGVRVAVALNPTTPLQTLEYILEDLDMVLIMTVNPGFGGQKFIPAMLRKIRELRSMAENLGMNLDIQVDGGIHLGNIAEVTKAGANVIVAGSAVFHAPDPIDMIKRMREEAEV